MTGATKRDARSLDYSAYVESSSHSHGLYPRLMTDPLKGDMKILAGTPGLDDFPYLV